MNTRTFETMSFYDMKKEIEDAKRAGREPDTYIEVGNMSRAERRRRDRAATKAMKKLQKKGRITA